MTTTEPPAPLTLTARCPEDLLALVPIVLGFVPTDSVVMLTFGAEHAFHARVDLPDAAEAVDEVVGLLLEPARTHRVRQVVFVAYTGSDGVGRRIGRALDRAFTRAGLRVVEMLRADDERWFPLVGRRPGVPEWGVPYDVGHHPFRAQAVVDGRVTLGSRAELAATVAPEPEQVSAVAALLTADWSPGSQGILTEGRWVRDLVERHVAAATVPSDAEVARLVQGLRELGVRDAAWALITRGSARPQLDFWADLCRRTPSQLRPAPAALLGWAAWQAGHGALAWCAVDLCVEADPDYAMTTYLAAMLENAVPPSAWAPDADWTTGLAG